MKRRERTKVRSRLFSGQLFLSQSGISSLPEEPPFPEVAAPSELVPPLVQLFVPPLVLLLPEPLLAPVVSVCFTSGRVVER